MEVCGFPDIEPIAPVTNAGTNSSYTTAKDPVDDRVHTAGAFENTFGTLRPAGYLSEGACWTAVTEASEHRVVDRAFTKGLPVTGTYSGTTSRLSGTSAAAALVSKDLVLKADPDQPVPCAKAG